MNIRFRNSIVYILAVAYVTFASASAFAQSGGGGHGGGGGHEEGAGSNLSVPLIFAEGVGITGAAIDLADPATTGLRYWTPSPNYKLQGVRWYTWDDGGTQQVCDPAQPNPVCPPAPEPPDLKRVYLQADENNIWQADWLDGSLNGPIEVSTVNWGDDIESHVWSTRQRQVRVEMALSKSGLDPSLDGYTMQYLSGRGETENWGVLASHSNPPVPELYQTDTASVYSPCLRLTIQKIVPDTGSPDAPPTTTLTWNAASGAWNGAAYTILNRAVWEGLGLDGPATGLGGEINIKGQMIYGYNWQVLDMILPPPVRKVGWYRLTFSLDGSTAGGKACGTLGLNSSMRNAMIAASEETEGTMEEEEEEGPVFTAALDAANNLTYLDLYIAPGMGEAPTNNPPVADAGSDLNLSCTGVITNVFLSGSESYDLDSDRLSYSWSHNCDGATMSGESTANPVLALTEPGTGLAQSCTVTMTVTELDLSSPLSSSDTLQINVAACPVDCLGDPFGRARLDACGVCDGQNACFDCTGLAFGQTKVDRCGICGGDGSGCLSCSVQNVSRDLTALQKQTATQLNLVRQAVRQARLASRKRTLHRKEYRLATQLAARNNQIVSTLPAMVSQCASSFCINIEQSGSFDEYLKNTNRLQTQLRVITRTLERLRRGAKARDLRAKELRASRQIRQLLGELPAIRSSCS